MQDPISGISAARQKTQVARSCFLDVSNDRLPKKLLFGAVKMVELAGITGMHRTGCSGETRLVLHVPSSS